MSNRERQLKLARIGMEDIMASMPSEYAKMFIRTRRELADLRLRNDKDIMRLWYEAAEQIAKDLRKLPPGYERDHLRSVLTDTLRELNFAYRDLMKDDLSGAIKIQYDFQRDIMISIMAQAEVENIGPAQLNTVYTGLAKETTQAFLARKTNNVPLSSRIWNNNQRVISHIVKAASQGGISAYDLAPQLEKYLKQGRDALSVSEYTNMMERFDGRLPADLKYDSFRLARTEISNAFAESTYSAGGQNPFYEGIDWRLSGSHDSKLSCVCPDLVGFHIKGSEPPIPHPNCLCTQLPRMKPTSEAAELAIKWVNNPATNPNLERWYQDTYLKFIA